MTSLLLATLALTLSGFVAVWLLRCFKVDSPLLHRFAWGLVLAQGLIFAGIQIELPLLDAPTILPPAFEETTLPSPLADRSESSATTSPLPSQPSAQNNSNFDFNPIQAIGTTWLLGALTILLFYFVSYASLLIAVRRTNRAPKKWADQWQRVLVNNNIRKSVPLRVHDRLGPMLCRLPGGYAVIVPSAIWHNLTESQRQAVLEHEVAHMRRGDVWKTFIARLAIVPHWFNPMAWKAVKHFEEAAEWACDQKMAARDSQVIDYAKALLQLAEPEQPLPLGASLARGAALSPRLDRLVNGRRKRDSILKCLGFTLLISAITIVAAIRFEVVAKEATKNLKLDTNPEFIEQLGAFSDGLAGSGEQLDAFRGMLSTKVGQIAMKDRAARAADHLRQESAANALTNFLTEHFEKSGEGDDVKFVLKNGQEGWRDQLLKQREYYREDIDKMEVAFKETKASLVGKSEIDQLLIRFLNQEGAAALLYAVELKKKVRPDVYGIAEELGTIFTNDGKGNFIIPESRTEAATEFNAKAKNLVPLTEALHEELTILASDLAEPDDLHKRLKVAAANSLFASLIAYQVGEKGEQKSVTVMLDEALRNVDEAFVDRGDGLHLADGKEPALEKLLATYDEALRRSERLRDPVQEFGYLIPEKDELHKSWRKFVLSEVGLMTLIHKVDIGSVDAGELFKQTFGKALEPVGKDGKQRVSEAKKADVEKYVQKALRTVREARRKGRQFDRMAKQIEDTELREILLSSAGKMIVGQSIKRRLESEQFDGLGFWIEMHFNRNKEGKLTAKASAGEAISKVMEDANEIAANLKSDF